MTEEQHNAYVAICKAWDELDRAAQGVITALPFQMTEASERLDKARLKMREIINSELIKVLFPKEEK